MSLFEQFCHKVKIIKTSIFLCIAVAVFMLFLPGKAEAGVSGIIVDGNSGDWDSLGILPLISDGNEGTIPDDYDLKDFYAANNINNICFRLDVFGTPTFDRLHPSNPVFYQVFLDIDQNPDTGFNVGGIGADKYIDYRAFSGVSIYNYDSLIPIGSGYGAQAGTTEIGVSLSDLGLSAGMSVDLIAYLDNGFDPPDDLTGYVTYEVVPEPLTLLLLGFGLSKIFILGLKKKKFTITGQT